MLESVSSHISKCIGVMHLEDRSTRLPEPPVESHSFTASLEQSRLVYNRVHFVDIFPMCKYENYRQPYFNRVGIRTRYIHNLSSTSFGYAGGLPA